MALDAGGGRRTCLSAGKTSENPWDKVMNLDRFDIA